MPTRVTFMGILSELALWGAIILVVVYGVSWIAPVGKRPFKDTVGQEIELRFLDASQLSEGSPVHFMGTDIGYVTKVRPKGYSVKVTIKTYPDAVEIPKGSRFSVQFNGLAGAKSVEVSPPRKNNRSQKYIVQNPVRMRDLLNTQMVLAKALESSSENLEKSLGDTANQSKFVGRLHKIEARTQQIDRMIDRTQHRANTIVHQIHNAVADAGEMVQLTSNALLQVERVTNPQFFHSNTMVTLRNLTAATEKTYHSLYKTQSSVASQQFQTHLKGSSQQINQTLMTVQMRTQQLGAQLQHVPTHLQVVHDGLGRVLTVVQRTPMEQLLHGLASHIRDARQRSETLSRF